MAHRILEIDWLKSVCIVLMVTFHLVYIETTYPYAKEAVYVFHMPVFLLISGYFARRTPSATHLRRMLWRIGLPYLLMESAYIVGAAFLPIREHIATLTPAVFFYHLFLHPLGPYWFLHTLLLCLLASDLCARIAGERHPLLRLALFGVCLLVCYAFSFGAAPLALWYLIGMALALYAPDFMRFFRPRWWMAIAAVVLMPLAIHYKSWWVFGAATIYAVISSLLAFYPVLPVRARAMMTNIGQHTLPILLFSPLFTFAVKVLGTPLIAIDSTGLLFLVVALPVCIGGSMAIGKMLRVK